MGCKFAQKHRGEDMASNYFSGLSRRSFLKSATIAAAGVYSVSDVTPALAKVAKAESKGKGAVEVINTHHRIHCHGSCMLKAHVQDGRLIHITSMGDVPMDEAGTTDEAIYAHQRRACPRGLSERYRLYSPDRLKYPLIQTRERGDITGFKQISWEEATKKVGSWLKEMKAEEKRLGYLPVWTIGESTAQFMGTTLGTFGHHSAGNQMDVMFATVGAKTQGNPAIDMLNSKLIVIWSTDTRTTQPQHSFMLIKAKEAGIPIVVVDTRFTDTAATYGTGVGDVPGWIGVRPGTDPALQAAMAYVIYKKGLHDEAFIKEKCFGFYPNDKVISKSTGKHPGTGAAFAGKEYVTPKGLSFVEYLDSLEDEHGGYKGVLKWASDLTGVSSDVIEAFAMEYGKAEAASFFCGWTTGGAQRTANGLYYSWMLVALSAMTGNIDKRGGGFGMVNPHDGYKLSIGKPAAATKEKKTKPILFSNFFSSDVIMNGIDARTKEQLRSDVLTMNKIDLGEDAKIELQMIYRGAGSNDVFNQRGSINKKLEAWNKVKYIVSHEFHMSATARYSDIIFPAAMSFEQSYFTNGQMNCELDVVNKVVEPMYEIKPDWEINELVGKHAGIEFNRADDISVMKKQWESAKLPKGYEKINKDIKLPSFEEMVSDAQFRLPTPLDKTYIDLATKKAGELTTDTGLINFYSPYFHERGRLQTVARAGYVAPVEGYETILAGKKSQKGNFYKLQFITPHVIHRAHSSFDKVPILADTFSNAIEIHPTDAKTRGIEDGATVYVYNDTGCIKTTANVTRRIVPGVIAVYEGAWYQPDTSETYSAVVGMDSKGKPVMQKVPVDIGANVSTITKDMNVGAADPFINGVTNKSGGFVAGGMLCEVSTQKPS